MRIGGLVSLFLLVAGCSNSAPTPAPTAKQRMSQNRVASGEVSHSTAPAARTGALDEKPAPGETPDLSYLPDDAFAVLVLNARRALESPALAGLPYDELFAASMDAWNFDPRQIEHLLLFVTPPVEGEPLGTPYSPGAVLRFSEAVDGPAIIAKRAGHVKEVQLGDKTYYAQIAQPATAFYLADDRTIVFAAQKQLEKMLSPTHVRSPLAARLQAADGDCDVHIIINVEPLTPALDAVAEAAGQQLPESAMPYVKALRDVSMITATADLSGERLLSVSIEARDAAAGTRLAQLAKESGSLIQTAYASVRAQILRAWIEDAAQAVVDITDQIVRRAVVVYRPEAIQIELAKLPQLNELGRRLRTALARQPVQR